MLRAGRGPEWARWHREAETRQVGRCRGSGARYAGGVGGSGGMQVLGSLAGGGGLGGVTLGRAQVGDVLDQRGEPQP